MRIRTFVGFASLIVVAAAIWAASQQGVPKELTSAHPTTWPHPEQTEDEVFLGNVDLLGYVRCGWQKKRLGTIAYSQSGKVINRVSREIRDKLMEEAKSISSDQGLTQSRREGLFFPSPRIRPTLANRELQAASYTHLPLFVKRAEIINANLDPNRFSSFTTKPESP